MSRFSRVFASGSSLRFASASVVAALFASLLMLPNTARAQGLYTRPSPNLNARRTAPRAVAAGDFARSGFRPCLSPTAQSRLLKCIWRLAPAHLAVFTPMVHVTACPHLPDRPASSPQMSPTTDIPTSLSAAPVIVDVLQNNGSGSFGQYSQLRHSP